MTYQPLYNIADGSGGLNCPAPWVYSAAADVSGVVSSNGNTGACVIPAGNGGCYSVTVDPTVRYRFLRGTVLGVQYGRVCAFGPTTRSKNLNGMSLAVSG